MKNLECRIKIKTANTNMAVFIFTILWRRKRYIVRRYVMLKNNTL